MGVDAPETGQDFGTQAKKAASDLAFGKDVTVRVHDTDRYVRTVAEVNLPDRTNLDRDLVERGYAWYYRTYAPDNVILNRAEVSAKRAHLGLWSRPNPTPPRAWRHPKVAASGQVFGNRRSHAYHASNCPSAAKMKKSNRVAFRTAAAAEAAGVSAGGGLRVDWRGATIGGPGGKPMMTPMCPKCAKTMDEGFMVDHTYGANLQAEWVGGAPQKSFWTSIKLGDAERRKITTYCCPACGFLESYAGIDGEG